MRTEPRGKPHCSGLAGMAGRRSRRTRLFVMGLGCEVDQRLATAFREVHMLQPARSHARRVGTVGRSRRCCCSGCASPSGPAPPRMDCSAASPTACCAGGRSLRGAITWRSSGFRCASLCWASSSAQRRDRRGQRGDVASDVDSGGVGRRAAAKAGDGWTERGYDDAAWPPAAPLEPTRQKVLDACSRPEGDWQCCGI